MSEKRFKIYQDMYENLYIEDNETGVGIGVGNEEDVSYNIVSDIVQLLNELHEENEQLKTELTELKASKEDNYNITDGLW